MSEPLAVDQGRAALALRSRRLFRASFLALLTLILFGSGCSYHQVYHAAPRAVTHEMRAKIVPATKSPVSAKAPEKKAVGQHHSSVEPLAQKDENSEALLEVPESLRMHFKTGSAGTAGFAAQDLETLQRIARFARNNPGTRIRVEGHTDSVGSEAVNLSLSQRRAESVRALLAGEFNLDVGRIEARGFGEERPVADNGTPQGRASNRRVLVVLLDAQGVALTPGAPRDAASTAVNARTRYVPRPSKPAMQVALRALRQEVWESRSRERETRYEVEISVTRRRLWLYEVQEGAGSRKLVRSHVLALPAVGERLPLQPGDASRFGFEAGLPPEVGVSQKYWPRATRLSSLGPTREAMRTSAPSARYGRRSARSRGPGFRDGAQGREDFVSVSHASSNSLAMRARKGMAQAQALYPDAKITVLR